MAKKQVLRCRGLLILMTLASGCSIRSLATRALANSLAGSGSNYSSDEDPELVEAAVPFGLKTMEQVLADQPRHVGLLTALASGFTQYAYAFVQQDADRLEDRDVAAARRAQRRLRKLYLRARDYGLRGLEVRHQGMSSALTDPKGNQRDSVLAMTKREDVSLLYWVAGSWALAISNSKDDLELIGQLPAVEAIMARALLLDESYDDGAIHDFYVTYDGGRSEAEGGGVEKARAHLERVLQLSKNKKLSPLVSFAETVSVARQDHEEFRRLLNQVLMADVDQAPAYRLANTIAQQRARWLLGREKELFAD
jgi:predicted anti-sigma-YlaC factor YlaD